MMFLGMGWLTSILLCSANHAGLLEHAGVFRHIISPIGEGSMTAFTIGGAFAANILASARFLSRPEWGISKIRATPSWVLICSAIMLVAFLLVYWLVDIQQKGNWFNLIKPAGTETLLCYLIPYYAYALAQMNHLWLPDNLLTGGIGLLKSMAFALLVIIIAGILSKKWIRLKL